MIAESLVWLSAYPQNYPARRGVSMIINRIELSLFLMLKFAQASMVILHSADAASSDTGQAASDQSELSGLSRETSIAVLIELCQCDNISPVTAPDDPSMDTLLDLDGQVLVVDPDGGHWVRFVVTRVPVSAEKPHGLDYSLTLHGPDGERLVGYDNAHRVAEQQLGDPQDHRHRLRTITAYEYRNAAALLSDFWNTVDSVLRERGIIT